MIEVLRSVINVWKLSSVKRTFIAIETWRFCMYVNAAFGSVNNCYIVLIYGDDRSILLKA